MTSDWVFLVEVNKLMTRLSRAFPSLANMPDLSITADTFFELDGIDWNEEGNDGEGGIRTHGGVTPTPVFETGLFNRSSTSPEARPPILAANG
jgi:hypothetical protein